MDIVKRLRRWSPEESTHELLSNAADEIERLRESLKVFADNVKETNMGIDENWAKTVYPLKAENQRLREALTGLYEACKWEKISPEIDAARQALGEKE